MGSSYAVSSKRHKLRMLPVGDMRGLEDFEAYLRDRKIVFEKRIPYYLHWVSLYLDFARKTASLEKDVTLAAFLRALGKTKEEWQVEQAREAVRLYRYFREKVAGRKKEYPLASCRRKEGSPLDSKSGIQRFIVPVSACVRAWGPGRCWRNGTCPSQAPLASCVHTPRGQTDIWCFRVFSG